MMYLVEVPWASIVLKESAIQYPKMAQIITSKPSPSIALKSGERWRSNLPIVILIRIILIYTHR